MRRSTGIGPSATARHGTAEHCWAAERCLPNHDSRAPRRDSVGVYVSVAANVTIGDDRDTQGGTHGGDGVQVCGAGAAVSCAAEPAAQGGKQSIPNADLHSACTPTHLRPCTESRLQPEAWSRRANSTVASRLSCRRILQKQRTPVLATADTMFATSGQSLLSL